MSEPTKPIRIVENKSEPCEPIQEMVPREPVGHRLYKMAEIIDAKKKARQEQHEEFLK